MRMMPRRKVGFPELVERFRATHPGMSWDEAQRELARRSAEARRVRAEQRAKTQKIQRWWDN